MNDSNFRWKTETVVEMLPKQHEAQARETLVSAFTADPGIVHLFPGASDRPVGMAHLYRLLLRYCRRCGMVEAAPAEAAVAAWTNPDHTWSTWGQLVRAGMLATPFALGVMATLRLLRTQRMLDRLRRRLLNVPHWYLLILGVRPGHQGRGLGAALIRHGVERARRTGFPCYLETANACNLPFYEKHGFHIAGQQRLPPGGPTFYGLVSPGSRSG